MVKTFSITKLCIPFERILTLRTVNKIGRLAMFIVALVFIALDSYGTTLSENEVKVTTYLYKTSASYKLSVEDGVNEHGYKKLEDPVLNLGFFKGSVWLKIPCKGVQHQLMLIKHPLLDFGVLYHKNDGSLTEISRFGDEIAKDYHPTHRYPTIDLAQHDSLSDTLYLFVLNRGEQFYLPIQFEESETFLKLNQYEYPLMGGYIGILVFAVLFNLFIAVVLKEKHVFHYCFYLVCLLILQLSLNGLGSLLFWGDSNWFLNRANVIFSSASIFFLLNFTIGFLPIKQHLPKAYLFINSAKYLVGINAVLSLFFPLEHLIVLIIFINAITFVFGITIIPISYVVYKNYFKEARYFLLAFSMLVICVFAFVLRNIGLIPDNFISENGLQIGSSVEAVLLTFAIIDKFKGFREQAIERLHEITDIKEKANVILEEQVKTRTAQLENSYDKLALQKRIVEEKNKEITESINYGEKIQKAILPSLHEISKKVSSGFVFFKPKDIVSGDFYWVSHKGRYSYYVVADCTGHGVPGAFMSMIGNTLLSQIINKENIEQPSDILNQLREEVIQALNQSVEKVDRKDGMDLALVRINHVNNEVVFSGANNPMYIVSDQNIENAIIDVSEEDKGLYKVAPNKQPIGFQTDDSPPFQSTALQLKKGDVLYLFTDGYPDQFGGPKGKKVKYKKFKQLLLSGSGDSMDEQKVILEEFLAKWMEEENIYEEEIFQIDDICVVGLRI